MRALLSIYKIWAVVKMLELVKAAGLHWLSEIPAESGPNLIFQFLPEVPSLPSKERFPFLFTLIRTHPSDVAYIQRIRICSVLPEYEPGSPPVILVLLDGTGPRWISSFALLNDWPMYVLF